jgi:urease accessory protein
MLKAISMRTGGESSAEPFGTVILDSADRHLRRKLITTNQGTEVMVDLPEAVLFADGDLLVLEDGRTIEIIAAKEKLYEVRPGANVPVSHLAWHLGNRHLAAQIDEDRILIRRDHVIRAMLEGLGATVTDVIERFQPVHGAYHAQVHHGHDHGQAREHHHTDHAHDHEHGHHHHGHAHDAHASQGEGKRDKYGRLPGDPHYGHNHG